MIEERGYRTDGFKADGFKTDGFKTDGFRTYVSWKPLPVREALGHSGI